MYDTTQVLASIDRNAVPILLLCGLAMLCNYTWFIAAVRQGLRDRTTPIPVFCTLFWLIGDASMVLRYDLWFNVIDHWYVKLFWAALVLTVLCELVFLSLTLRFGHREFAPALSRNQFVALILLGVAAMAVAFETVDGFGDRAWREVQRAGDIGRATGAELAEEEEELAPCQRYAFFGHRFVHQPVNPMVELEQSVGNFECLLHDRHWNFMRCHVKWQ